MGRAGKKPSIRHNENEAIKSLLRASKAQNFGPDQMPLATNGRPDFLICGAVRDALFSVFKLSGTLASDNIPALKERLDDLQLELMETMEASGLNEGPLTNARALVDQVLQAAGYDPEAFGGTEEIYNYKTHQKEPHGRTMSLQDLCTALDRLPVTDALQALRQGVLEALKANEDLQTDLRLRWVDEQMQNLGVVKPSADQGKTPKKHVGPRSNRWEYR
ncbi:hypothetical protein IPJ72_05420 [Candidatus Peregrinibacteria bacterium]|nr:MAG: hypothetical protein IPJ72_05420 [Candidatus Peregrinibacteria bacterium]